MSHFSAWLIIKTLTPTHDRQQHRVSVYAAEFKNLFKESIYY